VQLKFLIRQQEKEEKPVSYHFDTCIKKNVA